MILIISWYLYLIYEWKYWHCHDILYCIITVLYKLHHRTIPNVTNSLQTRAYIGEFKKAREMWKEKERLQQAEENRRIVEFAEQQQSRESGRMAVRRAEEESKDQVRNQLAARLGQQNKEAEELQQWVHLD